MAKRPLHLSTPAEVRQALTKIINETRNGDLSPSVANALICGCNAVLNSLRLDVQERKLEELEAILEEHEAQ